MEGVRAQRVVARLLTVRLSSPCLTKLISTAFEQVLPEHPLSLTCYSKYPLRRGEAVVHSPPLPTF